MSTPQHDLELLIRSRHPLLAIASEEEERVTQLLHRAAVTSRLPFHAWSVTRGLQKHGQLLGPEASRELLGALQSAAKDMHPAVWFFKDLGAWLHEPQVVRQVADVAGQFRHDGRTLAFLARRDDLPEPLRQTAAHYTLALPDRETLRSLAWQVVHEFGAQRSVTMGLSAPGIESLLDGLMGMTQVQAERTLREAIADDHALTEADLPRVQAARRELLQEDGALEVIEDASSLGDVGGLSGLKTWLERRRGAFTPDAAAFGLPPPKGVVLLGVQGCGKSLAAKAVAGSWGLPLLKLEAGRLYDKYIGESDKRLERALAAASRLAPCVLWMDEIEKAFSFTGGSSEADGGLSRRLVGRLLGWLQDRDAPVFIVATCNDVSQMPPELLRKGRFDEVFFVDLPSATEREAILALHLIRRGREPGAFDLAALAAASEGFSGAELEQAIVSALYGAFADGAALDTERLAAEIRATRPLSVLRAEDVARLRHWAHGRAVPAGAPAPE